MKSELKKLWVILPIFLVTSILIGLFASINQVWSESYLHYRLFHLAIEMSARILNLSILTCLRFFLLVLPMVIILTLIFTNFSKAARICLYSICFYLLLFSSIYVYVQIITANMDPLQVPDSIRNVSSISLFLNKYFIEKTSLLNFSDLLRVRFLWLPSSFILAFSFAIWMDRGLIALSKAIGRRFPKFSFRKRNYKLALWIIAAVCAVIPIFINLAAGINRNMLKTPQPNVILISLDTVRADALSCNGNPRRTTPILDMLAKSGIRFQNAISSSPWTLPSHAALMTSLSPATIQVRHVTDRISPQALTLAEALKESGYLTGAIVSYILVDESYGFGQGFDYFLYNKDFNAEKVVDEGLKFIDAHESQKFFLFLHFYDCHWPYKPPRANAEKFWGEPVLTPELAELMGTDDYLRFALKLLYGRPRLNRFSRAMYDAELNFIDEQLGRLFSELLGRKLLDRTIIVVFADHGEEFLEHGLHGHGLTLYDEVMRVPLLIRYPLLLPSAKVITEQVQLLDVFPTILSLADIRHHYHLEGRDLIPLIYAQGNLEPNRFVFMETAMSGEMRYGIRSTEFKYLTAFKLNVTRKLKLIKSEESYHLTDDPAEQHDMCSVDPNLCTLLKDKLNKYKETLEGESKAIGVRLGTSRELSIEERERLRSLGYLH